MQKFYELKPYESTPHKGGGKGCALVKFIK